MHLWLIPVPYGSIGCTYHQLKPSYPNRSKKKKKTRATQKSLPFRKWRFRSDRTRQKNKRGDIEKWDHCKLTALRFQRGWR